MSKSRSGYRDRDGDILPYGGGDEPSQMQRERLRSLSKLEDGGRELEVAGGYQELDSRRRASEAGYRVVTREEAQSQTNLSRAGYRERERSPRYTATSATGPPPGQYRELDVERFRERDREEQRSVRFLEPRFPKDYGGDPRHSLQELSISRPGQSKYYEDEDDVESERWSDDETRWYGHGRGGGGSVARSRSTARRSENFGRRRRPSTYEEDLADVVLPMDDVDGGSGTDIAVGDLASRAGDHHIDAYRSHDPMAVGMPRPKRIIICCDGTWLDADNALRNKQLLTPSNVTRLGRAIKAIAADGTPQVVFYQEGIGAEGGRINKAYDGVTGSGIAGHIREAYSFLCNNYVDGDEIFFVGFSRGAFTARSVASMVSHLGLLTKAGLPDFPIIFEDFQHRHEPDYRSRARDIPFARKPSASDPAYVDELARLGLTTPGVTIKAIAVWETVGSLGIPRINWLERVGLQNMGMRRWNFYDTSLNPLIEHAFQALALDEQRAAFQPAVWELRNDNDVTELMQVWFPGVHSNVGGGYKDQELANITLAWMMSMLSPFLDFDDRAILRMDENNKHYQKRPRPWSFGKIYNSMTGVYAVGGTQDRTPGQYARVDPANGAPTRHFLRRTNEFIHPSVRTRTILQGPGREDEGDYRAKGLRKFRLVEDETGKKFWKRKNSDLIIPECSMGEVEMMLLEKSPKMFDYLTDPRN